MKKNNRILIFVLCLGLIAAGISSCIEKTAAALTEQLHGDDSIAISALVLYPDTVRQSIFEVCKYPAAVHKVADLQEKTSKDFEDLIKDYPQDQQEEIWDMTRYPDLVDQLAAHPDMSDKSFLNEYPDDITETAVKYNSENHELVAEINELQNKSDKEFNDIIKDYPPETQEAFREVIEMPEVLTILDEHDDMTKEVGDLYEKNPDLVIKTADSINKVVVQQNAENLEVWKDQIASDAEAKQDLETASQEYAASIGYTEEEYTSAPSYYYIHEYEWYPYPYWFGYPYWYPYDYWYPYPYWYDWGFYYGPGNSIVVIGEPSYYFTYWYFYYPVHYYHHPHLANAYINYYYGPHRRGNDYNAVIVGKWIDDNRKYLPADFETNKNSRVEAIKQLGQFEEDYQKGNGLASRDAYFNSHKENYPALHESNERKVEKQNPGLIQHESNDQNEPVKQPKVKMKREGQQQQQQMEQKEGQTQQVQRKTGGSGYDYDKMNPAQQYHRSTWDQQQQRKGTRQQQPRQRKHGGG